MRRATFWSRMTTMPGEPGGHLDRLLSGLGGFAGLLGVALVSHAVLGLQGAAGLVASMGSSAVLLFAVPRGPLSQPWSLVGGHFVSALIGVACAKLIPDPMLAFAVAGGGSITAMYYLRCTHPPGGATALTAVIGGDAVSDLGFQFVFTPVMANVVVILAVAVVFNYPFPWRRYPTALNRRVTTVPSAMRTTLSDAEIVPGAYYSNGASGAAWEVRHVLGRSGSAVRYRVVAGQSRGTGSHASLDEFMQWVSHEVARHESAWRRAVRPAQTAALAVTA